MRRMEMSKFSKEETGLEVMSESEYQDIPRGIDTITEVIRSMHPNTVENMVRKFHNMANLPVRMTTWNTPNSQIQIDLIDEEYRELEAAVYDENDVAELDAICDLVYVLVGLCVRHGWDFDEAFKRVHHSNMTKVLGKKRFRRDGKILKPKGWAPPDLRDLV